MARKFTKQEERKMQKYPETDTFIWGNENPKGHITNDCVIRAIAGATGLPWDVVLEGIHSFEKKLARRNDNHVIGKYLEAEGWVKHASSSVIAALACTATSRQSMYRVFMPEASSSAQIAVQRCVFPLPTCP